MKQATTHHPASILILALGSAACGPDGAHERTSETTVTDSAGIEIVSNGSMGSLGELRLEETLRLGRVDGEGPELFSRIVAVRWGPEGRIYVGNGGSTSVRAFDADGTFLTEFGGFGGGPAELPVMLNDVLVARDSVVLIDWQRTGRVLLFGPDGEFLHGRAVRGPDGTSHVPAHRAPDGWLWYVTPMSPTPSLRPGERLDRERDIHLMSFDAAEPGPLVHRVPMVPLYGTRSEGEGAVDWRLFEIGNRHAAFDAAGRMYVTSGDAYRIDVFELGQLVRSIRRDFPLRAITSDDVDAYRAASLAILDTLSMPDEMRPDQRERVLERVDRQAELGLPDVFGPFSGLLVSTDGSFWAGVRTDVTPAQAEVRFMWGGLQQAVPVDPTTWDLFDERGAFLGGVTLPARFQPHAVDGLEVIGVQTDNLDVEYVVRYEVIPGVDPDPSM